MERQIEGQRTYFFCLSHFNFGATMDFDRESSPNLPCSSESSVEFVMKTPGPDWEDNQSTIILSDREDGPPRKKILMEYFRPTSALLCPLGELYHVLSLQTIHQFAQLTLSTQVQASEVAHHIKPAQTSLYTW